MFWELMHKLLGLKAAGWMYSLRERDSIFKGGSAAALNYQKIWEKAGREKQWVSLAIQLKTKRTPGEGVKLQYKSSFAATNTAAYYSLI